VKIPIIVECASRTHCEDRHVHTCGQKSVT